MSPVEKDKTTSSALSLALTGLDCIAAANVRPSGETTILLNTTRPFSGFTGHPEGQRRRKA
jgi:hypothetical protein